MIKIEKNIPMPIIEHRNQRWPDPWLRRPKASPFPHSDEFLLEFVNIVGIVFISEHDFDCRPEHSLDRLEWLYHNKPELWKKHAERSELPIDGNDFSLFIKTLEGEIQRHNREIREERKIRKIIKEKCDMVAKLENPNYANDIQSSMELRVSAARYIEKIYKELQLWRK